MDQCDAAPSSFVHVTVAPLLTLSCAGVKAKPLAQTALLFAASGVPSLWIEIRSQERRAGHRDEIRERVGAGHEAFGQHSYARRSAVWMLSRRRGRR